MVDPKLQKNAARLKTQIQALTSSAITLESCITTDERWKWANNDANLGKLKRHMGDLRTLLEGCQFAKQMVTSEWRDIRPQFSTAHLEQELNKFVARFTKYTQELDATIQRLNRMHKAVG